MLFLHWFIDSLVAFGTCLQAVGVKSSILHEIIFFCCSIHEIVFSCSASSIYNDFYLFVLIDGSSLIRFFFCSVLHQVMALKFLTCFNRSNLNGFEWEWSEWQVLILQHFWWFFPENVHQILFQKFKSRTSDSSIM